MDINKQDFQIDVLVLENWCVEKRRHMCNITNEIKTNNKADEDEENLIKFVDSLIEKAWIYGNNQYFKELFNLVETKKINGIYQDLFRQDFLVSGSKKDIYKIFKLFF